jgi:tripartite ATP-independent transporter DctM subunit
LYARFSVYDLSVIPLFLLMGQFATQGGLSRALFQAAASFVGHFRGGLAMAAILACAAFGAICGSSVATAATVTQVAMPEMRAYKYSGRLATATLAAGGTLGILIPPSVVLVVYAILTEQNIAKLFAAAMIPGIIATVGYLVAIGVVVHRHPEQGPAQPRHSWAERLRTMRGVWPVVAIFLVVFGGIYGGVFTPTEGAAVGAIAMLVVGVAPRSLDVRGIIEAIKQTAETSAMIFIILLGSEVFDAFLALSRLPETAAQLVGQSGLGPYAIMLSLMLFYILLGAVMDELAMILLTLPVFFPIVQALDFGLPPDEVAIWFGILVLIVVGIGLTAPPIGLNVFVISSIAKTVPIAATYRGVLPFIFTDIVRLGLVLAFPGLALWLVRLLN